MIRYITILCAVALLASCDTTAIKQNPGAALSFNSNDWLRDRFKRNRTNPLNIEVHVTPEAKNNYFVNMDFKGDPQDPLRGINPTGVTIFSMCVNSHIANRDGHSAWVIGIKKDGLTARKRDYLLIVGDLDTLETLTKDQALKWLKPTLVSKTTKSCTTLLKDNFLW
ncbi:MAG: hypothetical protein OQK73_09735 [Gammaproteobacteria bacterium]|nr:hypothetical protein [Gammaproteobacteria bacterium]